MFNNQLDSIPLGAGVVVMIPKPDKPPRIENMQPITLLNTIQKILSLIVLCWIEFDIKSFLSQSQCGFLRQCKTTNAVFAHKLIVSKAMKFHWSVYILGIDLSKAFDTVDWTKLLDILRDFICPDCFHLIQVLLSKTVNNICLEDLLGLDFQSAIGVPQEDALSLVLFIMYLEAVLQDLSIILKAEFGIDLPQCIIYVDNFDFYFTIAYLYWSDSIYCTQSVCKNRDYAWLEVKP